MAWPYPLGPVEIVVAVFALFFPPVFKKKKKPSIFKTEQNRTAQVN